MKITLEFSAVFCDLGILDEVMAPSIKVWHHRSSTEAVNIPCSHSMNAFLCNRLFLSIGSD